MHRNSIARLPIAVRVYPESPQIERKTSEGKKRWRRPDAMFVFDTETRTDTTQRLIFGSYRFLQAGKCLEEGIFHADDISEGEREILRTYVSEHSAPMISDGNLDLLLLTKRQFLDKFYRAAYKGRCLVAGFNLPFDLSRIAHDSTNARGRFAGGFSLGIWSYIDEFSHQQRNKFRSRI